MTDLSNIYRKRFSNTGIEKRNKVWKVLCSAYFNKLVSPGDRILDLACGYGEFINNIVAGKKYAVDLNPDSPSHLNPDVTFFSSPANDLSYLTDNSVDVVFTSNFLEHLKDKDECNAVLTEVRRVLRPGGRFIIMGPNIRYCYKEYWDYYDHYLPLSHLSLSEGLLINGFDLESVTDRFLPYTMNNSKPTHDFLIRAYLAFPLAWKLFGAQFLVIGTKSA